MTSSWFKPLDAAPRERQVLAFDIEGSGKPNGFVCGSIQGATVAAFYTEREAMFKDLLGYAGDGFWIFSHNLQYDLPILEGPTFPRGDLLFTRDSLLWSTYTVRGRRVKFFESINLFPRHSIAAIGEMVGYEKDDLPEHILRKLSRGTTWSEFSTLDQERIRHYCSRDAEILYWGVVMLQELVLALGGSLKPTLSGTAMDLYRRKYHKWPWPTLGPKTNDLVRPAYYGGRVENFAAGQVEHVSMYDITSLYPFVQSQVKFPHPGHLRLDTSPSLTGEYWRGEGVIYAEVEVPERFVPTLPHRFDNRLFFPTGRMRGAWTIFELVRALGLGARLHKVEWVLWSPVVFNPFGEYVTDLFGLRQGYLEQGKGQSNLVKLLLNSLYGRWGLNPQKGLYHLVDIQENTDLTKLQGYQTQSINGRLVAFGRKPTTYFPPYVNVTFAAQIASAARIYLLDELLKQDEDLIYCDTDSIITRGTISPQSGLGGWRELMHDGSADLIGPKEYALFNQVLGDQYVAKGVPPEVAREYLTTGAARFWRALGIRESLRDHTRPSTWVQTFKGRREIFPKRYSLADWQQQGQPYSKTYPYRSQDLPQVVTGAYFPPDWVPDVRGPLLPEEPELKQHRLFSESTAAYLGEQEEAWTPPAWWGS